jgi:hypothetical protein
MQGAAAPVVDAAGVVQATAGSINDAASALTGAVDATKGAAAAVTQVYTDATGGTGGPAQTADAALASQAGQVVAGQGQVAALTGQGQTAANAATKVAVSGGAVTSPQPAGAAPGAPAAKPARASAPPSIATLLPVPPYGAEPGSPVLTDNETANPEFVQNTMKPLIRDMLAPSSRQEGVSCFCMYSVSRQEANHARRVAGLCSTLRRSCCEYADGPIAFRKAGGIKALVTILRTFASDLGVVEPACALAGAVCGPNVINARTFAREDGTTELLKALGAYPQSVTLTASAFTAIASILAAGEWAAFAATKLVHTYHPLRAS